MSLQRDHDPLVTESLEFRISTLAPGPPDDVGDVPGAALAVTGNLGSIELHEPERFGLRAIVAGPPNAFAGGPLRPGYGGAMLTYGEAGRPEQLIVLTGGEARSLGTPIRVGVHVGEILRRDDDIAGIAVHAAARISSLAGGDEVLVSRTVRDLTRGAGFNFEPEGTFDLKGLDETWDLFGVGG